MKISILPDIKGSSIKQYDIPWSELCRMVDNPVEYPTKEDQPLIKLATFGEQRSINGCLRHDGNVLTVTGIEGDYDKGLVSLQQAGLFLAVAGIKAVICTTASYTDAKPRWRVLVPFAVEYRPKERAGYVARLNQLLGGILATESSTLSQPFYLGKVKGTPYYSIQIDGGFIDELYKPIEIASTKHVVHDDPVQVDSVVLGELASALKSISSDDRDTWISIGQALSGLGEDGYRLWSEWSATSDKHNPDQDLWRWNGFTGSRTGYQAVFTRAQANGWINPRAAKPLELAAVGWNAVMPEGFGAIEGELLSARIDTDGFLHKTNGNRPQASVENLRYLLKCYGIKCSYDEILKQITILFHNGSLIGDNADNAALAKIESLVNINYLPTGINKLMPVIFNENRYNPVMEFVESKPWDGVSRIGALLNSITVSDDMIRHRDMLVSKWLVQCIAALDGSERSPVKTKLAKYELVLTFQGEQGILKTTWARHLLPRELSDYIKDGLHLDLADKDSKKEAISCWIGELGELDATFRKSDISRLKGFISKTHDEIRMPYDKVNCKFKRRTSFYASVNDEKFLVDGTGNRRYGALAVTSIDVEHGIDMQQLWAEILVQYLGGAVWWLDGAESKQLALVNEQFASIDPIEEMLTDYFFIDDRSGDYELMSATAIARHMGIAKPKASELHSIGRVLKKYKHERRCSNSIYGYRLRKKLITDNIKWDS